MFALVTSDVHIHPHKDFNSYDAEGNSWRVERGIKALRQVFDNAQRCQCPIFIAGDLLHDKRGVPTEVIAPLKALFEEFANVTVRLVVGNHERPDMFSRSNTLAWLDNGDTHKVIDRPSYEVFHHLGFDVAVFFLPWSGTLKPDIALLNERLAKFSTDEPDVPRILIGHGCIDGAKADNGYNLTGEMTIEELQVHLYNLVLFGDIHVMQRIAVNAFYTGALLQNRSSECANIQSYTAIDAKLSPTVYPVVDIPQFTRTDDIEKIGKIEDETGEISLAKPSAEAIAKSIAASLPKVRMVLDLSDLKTTVSQYMTATEATEFTFDEVWFAIEQEMARATGN